MSLVSSLAYAKTCVAKDAGKELEVWAKDQPILAVYAILDEAILNNAWLCVATLLKQPQCQKDVGMPILRQQVWSNNLDAVKHLCKVVNPFCNSTQESAVNYCIKTNNIAMFDLLLEGAKHTINTNELYECDYCNLLETSARSRNIQMFKRLVEYYPQVWEDTNIYHLLGECVENRAFDILSWVMAHTQTSWNDVARLACQFHSAECFQIVKNHLSDQEYSQAILSYCADQGNLDILEIFGLDKNKIQWEPHHIKAIIASGNLQLFQTVVPQRCEYTLCSQDYSNLFQSPNEEKILDFLDWMITQVNPALTESYALSCALSQDKWICAQRLLPVSDPNILPQHVILRMGQSKNLDFVDQMCARVGSHIKQDIFENAALHNNVLLLAHLINEVNPKYNRSESLLVAVSNNCNDAASFLLPYSDVCAHNFRVFQSLSDSESTFSSDFLLQAVAQAVEQDPNGFALWFKKMENSEGKNTIQHALNTLENQKIHAVLAPQSTWKKRKM